jgi:hypothetical protein
MLMGQFMEADAAAALCSMTPHIIDSIHLLVNTIFSISTIWAT